MKSEVSSREKLVPGVVNVFTIKEVELMADDNIPSLVR